MSHAGAGHGGNQQLAGNVVAGMGFRFPELPNELKLNCVEYINDPHDLFALSRTGNHWLYHNAKDRLLRIDETTREAALYWACKNGDIDLLGMTLKLDSGAVDSFWWPDVYLRSRPQQDNGASTPLAVAIVHRQFDTVEALLNVHGAYPNALVMEIPYWPVFFPGGPSRTPLEWAMDAGLEKTMRLRLVNLLIEHGSLINPLNFTPRVTVDELTISQALANDEVPADLLARMLWLTDDLNTPPTQTPRSYLLGDGYIYYQNFFLGRRNCQRPFTFNEMEKLRCMQAAVLDPTSNKRISWTHICFIEHALYVDLDWKKKCQLLELTLAGFSSPMERSPLTGQTLPSMAMNGLIVTKREGLKSKEDCENIISLLRMLLDAGMNLGQEVANGLLKFHENQWGIASTPLACLCLPKYYVRFPVGEIMDFLVQNGALVDAQDKFGLTALHYACKFTRTPRVKQLLNYGADLSILEEYGNTPLHLACRVEEPVNPDDLEGFPNPELSVNKRSDIMRLLLQAGADPTPVDKHGYTPFHYACQFGFLDAVSLILAACPSRGDDRLRSGFTCAVGPNSMTPLHIVGSSPYSHIPLSNQQRFYVIVMKRSDEKVKITKLLIGAGADTRARDIFGFMPIKYARYNDYPEIMSCLLEQGGDDGLGAHHYVDLDSDSDMYWESDSDEA